MTPADNAQEQVRARELFDRITRHIDGGDAKVNGNSRTKISRVIGEDLDMFVEIASLWQKENLNKTAAAVTEAVKICQSAAPTPTAAATEVRLLNNLAVMKHLSDDWKEARVLYEGSLIKATNAGSEAEGLSTTILYNLARVYEELGEDDLAKDAYEKLLTRHPEYVDGSFVVISLLTADTDVLSSQSATSSDVDQSTAK